MKNLVKITLFTFISIFSFSTTFKLESSAIKNGIIDPQYGVNGVEKIDNIPSKSLPLTWKNPPKGTKSFVVVMVDEDAIPVVGMTWIHWSVANIPANKSSLEINESRTNIKLIQGLNSWISPLAGLSKEKASFYGGPMPPDKDHSYKIIIYALNKKLDIESGFYVNDLNRKMKKHIIGTAELEAIYVK